jgi:hypothetical protein
MSKEDPPKRSQREDVILDPSPIAFALQITGTGADPVRATLAQTAPYWPSLVINGQEIDRSHLEPMSLPCACPQFPRPVIVNVTFSMHCFTGHFVDGVHDPAWKIMDGLQERVFCFTRHGLSLRLPGMVRSLPSTNVWQTRSDRNFVYAVMLDDGLGGQYPMFFTVKKDKADRADLALRVESAYPFTKEEMADEIKAAPKVKFATLCAKAVRNESLNFRKR